MKPITNTLHHAESHCISLHHTASHCITLHHTASLCITLEQTDLDALETDRQRAKHIRRNRAFCHRFCLCCVCCSVLQCVAVYCAANLRLLSQVLFALQCVAMCSSVLQCVAMCCSVLCGKIAPFVTDFVCVEVCYVCCSVWQCVAVCCSVFQCVAVYCAAKSRLLSQVLFVLQFAVCVAVCGNV